MPSHRQEQIDLSPRQRQQLLIDHANALICCEPTMLAGAVALMRYVASLDEWQEPVDRRDGDIDDTVRKWHQVFLNTMARALEKISAVG